MTILKGDISITDNVGFIRDVIYSNDIKFKIINLDEDNEVLPKHQSIICGTCLVPPIDALIAENNGDEMMFDAIYSEHFQEPYVDQFVGALIAALMSGINLLLFIPSLEGTNLPAKLTEQFWKRYGIGLGILGVRQATYDNSCIPIWLNYGYMIGCITGRDYLYALPEGATIPTHIMDYLLNEFSPYADSYESKVNFILDLVKKLKEKPSLVIPIFQSKE